MLELDLTDEELDILRQVLDDALSDLRMEISDTDSLDFREMLKRRKAAITRVLEAIGAGEPSR